MPLGAFAPVAHRAPAGELLIQARRAAPTAEGVQAFSVAAVAEIHGPVGVGPDPDVLLKYSPLGFIVEPDMDTGTSPVGSIPDPDIEYPPFGSVAEVDICT